MLTKTLKKILLASSGLFCILVGLISLFFPMSPGLIFIFTGILLCARSFSKKKEIEVRHKMLSRIKNLKIRPVALKSAINKITAMFY